MRLGLALGVLFALGWVPLYVCRAESVRAALPAYGGAERFWVLLTPILLAAHMTAACVSVSFEREISPWAAISSVAIFGSGVAFWFWGRVRIGPLRVRPLPADPPRQLCRDGAFGLVRHPLYFAYLLAAGAPLVVTRQVLLALSLALCTLALAVRAVQEERRLHAQLGSAYATYCREVKRLLPFVW